MILSHDQYGVLYIWGYLHRRSCICCNVDILKLYRSHGISHQKEYIRQRKIGRVYQNPAMGTCPSMTILENMSLADNKGKKFGLGFGTNKKRVENY